MIARMRTRTSKPLAPLAPVALDSIDLAILAVLQEDGRLPNSELAERVHLSPSACHRRVARLEAEGVIRGYAALLEPKAAGLLDAFEAAVARIPDVMECHLMAGSADYLLKIMARDPEDFARIHREALAQLPGVAQMQSSFSLKVVRSTTAIALD